MRQFLEGDYLIGIPFVNNEPLLRKAITSLRELSAQAFIIDNSRSLGWNEYTICTPTTPLSASQSINVILDTAKVCRKSIACFMHSDAEASRETVLGLIAACRDANKMGRKWGVAFTNYDALAAFNMEAVAAVGMWDVTLPQYFSDNDYYYRLRLAGYETINTDLPVIHHGSSTIRTDPERNFLNSQTFDLYLAYYKRKWGGEPGQEINRTAFNRGG